MQEGYLYQKNGAYHVRFYQTESRDGKLRRVQKSRKLATVADLKKKNPRVTMNSEVVKELFTEFMHQINNAEPPSSEDMRIADFWERQYLPYCERQWKGTGMKPSTVYGYKQIWNQHLKDHFADITLRAYTANMARRFLASLKTKQGKNTLRHLRALAGAMFGEAVERGLVDVNPWRGVKLPKDAIEPQETEHYTLEEAEDIISALVDHVDCQLVMALSCFLALRPGEIAALRWEDIDSKWIYIRRSVLRGEIGTPKTKESTAPLPVIDQVRIPLELWRAKCADRTEGYVFESRNGTPVDLHNLAARVIRPHIDGASECVRCEKKPKALKKTRWKTLYSGRRGAITAIIELNDGDAAVGQRWARHKSMTTTLNVYKKTITSKRLLEGAKKLEAGV